MSNFLENVEKPGQNEIHKNELKTDITKSVSVLFLVISKLLFVRHKLFNIKMAELRIMKTIYSSF